MARRRKQNPKTKSNTARTNPRIDSNAESGKTTENSVSKEEGTETQEVPKKNDVDWYARDPQLLLDAARIPFSNPLGDKIILHKPGEIVSPGVTEVDSAYDSNTDGLPGILSLEIVPAVGYANVKTDPVNVAATALYAHVRYVNSGRKNYDPSDLMMYCLAMADIYSFIFWCKRIYGQAFVYSQRNKYVGRDLLQVDHVNATSIINNLANFRYWLNAFINKVQSFAIPADIYYFKRRAFMFSNYYIENSDGNVKDQLYQFTPCGWYKFVLDLNNVGSLEYSPLPSPGSGMTFSDIANYGESLLQFITGDEDFGLMSGDILKAYEGNIIGLTQLEEDYTVTPIYDLYVLEQFHNATIVDVYKNNPSHTYTKGSNQYRYGSIYQSADGLLLSRECAVPGSTSDPTGPLSVSGLRIISSESPDPDPGYIVEETRLHCCLREQGTSLELNCGTEIAVRVVISYHDNSGNNYLSAYNSQYFKTTSQQGSTAFHWIFKYHPIIHLYNGYVDSGTNKYMLQVDLPVSNIDNYAIIDGMNIEKLHEVSLLSLFFVPGVARLVNFANTKQ